jgi:hypothetical protein
VLPSAAADLLGETAGSLNLREFSRRDAISTGSAALLLCVTRTLVCYDALGRIFGGQTHVPLALLGITFAWARWLELRLAPVEGAIAGLAWRSCFLLVALFLVLYREI